MQLTAAQVVDCLADVLLTGQSPLLDTPAEGQRVFATLQAATRHANAGEYVRAGVCIQRAYALAGGPWTHGDHGYLWSVRRHPVQVAAYGEPEECGEVPF